MTMSDGGKGSKEDTRVSIPGSGEQSVGWNSKSTAAAVFRNPLGGARLSEILFAFLVSLSLLIMAYNASKYGLGKAASPLSS
jgi:hypothetical protein